MPSRARRRRRSRRARMSRIARSRSSSPNDADNLPRSASTSDASSTSASTSDRGRLVRRSRPDGRRELERAHPAMTDVAEPLNRVEAAGARPWAASQASISALPYRSGSESASRPGRPWKRLAGQRRGTGTGLVAQRHHERARPRCRCGERGLVLEAGDGTGCAVDRDSPDLPSPEVDACDRHRPDGSSSPQRQIVSLPGSGSTSD